MHEFFGAGSDRQVSAKPSRFVASVLARTTGAVIWIGEEHLDLCVAGVEQAGLNPGRLICVTATQASFVELCEAVLREPGVAAVVADSRAAPDLNATRRLQLAAHERGATGFLLYRSTFLGSGASRCLSATRWKIAPEMRPSVSAIIRQPGHIRRKSGGLLKCSATITGVLPDGLLTPPGMKRIPFPLRPNMRLTMIVAKQHAAHGGGAPCAPDCPARRISSSCRACC